MANRVECLEELVYCRLPEGMEGYGGYKADILIDNLSEREINLFICRTCHGIKRGACFWEHRERPEVVPDNEEIRKQIDNIKVSCPIKIQGGCEWTGNISDFKIHIGPCYGNENPNNNLRHNTFNNSLRFKVLLVILGCTIFGLIAVSTRKFYLCSKVELINELVTKEIQLFEEAKRDLASQFNGYSSKADKKLKSLKEQINNIKKRLASSEKSNLDLHQALNNALVLLFEKKWTTTDALLSSLRRAFTESQYIPYSPQNGVIWTIYEIESKFNSAVEMSGPFFYVKEYKFQPSLESLKDDKACLTLCVALVNCDHYNKIKWPIQFRNSDKGFQVDVHSPNHIHTLVYFELNEDNRNYFKKPINEKNKPLCKQLICRHKIMKYIINDTLTMHIRTGDNIDET